MVIKNIEIKNFRNIGEERVEFHEGVNIIKGENAQGKTNLLEAIYYSSIGKSFRTQHEEEVLLFGEKNGFIKTEFIEEKIKQTIEVKFEKGRHKQFYVNYGKLDKIGDLVGTLRTVLFCPNHLSLIQEGPGERRKFLDIALSQLYPNYLHSLQRFNHIIKERNALLRICSEQGNDNTSMLNIYSEEMAKECAIIASYRVNYIQELAKKIKDIFMEMKGEQEVPEISYEGSCHLEENDYKDKEKTLQTYKEYLTTRLDREIGAETSLWGIHKDDICVKLNGHDARGFCSQGQQRSLALAFKLAEGELCKDICGEMPIFLFDDVFSELDKSRKDYLHSKLKNKQVIITTCEEIESDHIILVENGKFSKK